MKNIKKIFVFFVVFIFCILFVPNIVSAENKNYDAKITTISDYICEELNGRELIFGGTSLNTIYVRDVSTNKIYTINFSNLGVCTLHNNSIGDGVYDDDYVPTEYIWEGSKLYLETYNEDVFYFRAKTDDTVCFRTRR